MTHIHAATLPLRKVDQAGATRTGVSSVPDWIQAGAAVAASHFVSMIVRLLSLLSQIGSAASRRMIAGAHIRSQVLCMDEAFAVATGSRSLMRRVHLTLEPKNAAVIALKMRFVLHSSW